ncbi:ATP-binding protein [Cohnella panacarvi]|uniref:ATP-binding protein n=1 Tax=Cohnella panacarvi TaxID=400776 RepID=UPI00047D25BC|nr:ATP-binding protein [Cohnella panacarvi]
MWKDTLLQILIALLPVFLFMIWYDRPERTRYAPLFMSVACGITMLLTFEYTEIGEHGQTFDLRSVMLLIGSLYGGIPAAAMLTVLYIALRIPQYDELLQYAKLGVFLLAFLPVLFARTASFRQREYSERMKQVLTLSFIPFAFFIVSNIAILATRESTNLHYNIMMVVFYAGAYLFVTYGTAHLAELTYERVRMQTQLRVVSQKYLNEMHRLQQLIDHTPLSVAVFDSNGVLTRINEEALKHLHPLTRKELIGKDIAAIYATRDKPVDETPIARIMQGEEKVTDIVRFRGRTYYTVTCRIAELPSDRLEGILHVGQDITELERLKDEVGRMERLSLVGQMAASITHEIRNPMAVIRGFVQLLSKRGNADQESYFRIILDELDRANAIINDFLSLAQNRIVEKEPGNLHDLLNDVIPLIWADANMRGQLFEAKLCDNMEPLELNGKEIKQLILNLARNGMEAMNDKGVLRIETINLQDVVQLRVIDSGIGISKEKQERLFEPFYTTKASGTGLGLSLCLSIVERHNGKIHVESALGQGTTIIVSFCKPGRKCW